MRLKKFEITILNDMVSIKTDDFYYVQDKTHNGAQGNNSAQEQALRGLYRRLAGLVEQITENRHSRFPELSSFKPKESPDYRAKGE